MSDIQARNDILAPPPPPNTLPPAAKISREVGNIIRELAIIGALTAALLSGKMSPDVFAVMIGGFVTGHFALMSGKAIDAQMLREIMRR
jgi:hypothetical protein